MSELAYEGQWVFALWSDDGDLKGLTPRANDAFEWLVENKRGRVDIESYAQPDSQPVAAGHVLIRIYEQHDAALFKTFWL